uniref:Uncharacterized protein n=1 Tax=Populus alba TaxID=43335 RepID=A0A4U5PYM3_POPAL|nr:hypothetical protein D5086_0000161250 [Populus alba]
MTKPRNRAQSSTFSKRSYEKSKPQKKNYAIHYALLKRRCHGIEYGIRDGGQQRQRLREMSSETHLSSHRPFAGWGKSEYKLKATVPIGARSVYTRQEVSERPLWYG